MKLYHFTSHLAIPHIEREGICFGDIPLTQSIEAFGEDTGVWLSTSKDPKAQGWQNPRGKGPFIDNTAIRLQVEIPEEENARLWRWSDYAARNGVEENWQKILESVPGGGDHWFIFKGVILPAWIVAKVELKKRVYPPSFVQKWEEYKNGPHARRGRVEDTTSLREPLERYKEETPIEFSVTEHKRLLKKYSSIDRNRDVIVANENYTDLFKLIRYIEVFKEETELFMFEGATVCVTHDMPIEDSLSIFNKAKTDVTRLAFGGLLIPQGCKDLWDVYLTCLLMEKTRNERPCLKYANLTRSLDEGLFLAMPNLKKYENQIWGMTAIEIRQLIKCEAEKHLK